MCLGVVEELQEGGAVEESAHAGYELRNGGRDEPERRLIRPVEESVRALKGEILEGCIDSPSL